ncbi:MAG: NUDIX hydrolase [candidate division KSB1 bacterium]|nr:NUDIX hydrolase [candidate division KSB1 bacterium]
MSPDLYPPTPIVGVGVLVEREGAILLARRGAEPKAGHWSLPGGHVELGEPVREAARREVAEECHVDVEVMDVLDVCDLIIRDEQERVRYHYVLIDFLGKYLGGTARSDSDVLEVAWVPIGQLANYHLTDAVRTVVDKGLALLGAGLRNSSPPRACPGL